MTTPSREPGRAVLGLSLLRQRLSMSRHGRLVWWTTALAALGAAGLFTSLLAARGSASEPRALLVATFPESEQLITNERAYYDPHAAGVRVSPVWIATSGSLFSSDGAGWTGIPDDVSPNAASSNGNDSAVFRVVTRRSNFLNVNVSFQLRVAGLVTTRRTPATSYDGVHVFLRYQNQRHLYVVSVYRRDGIVAIKEKIPGGPANGGTYFTLAQAPYRMPMDRWVSVNVSIATLANGEVSIELFVNDDKVLSSTGLPDRVTPILAPGRVGLRGDNCQFFFRDFTVRSAM
jgi:hypothetical protein